MVLESVEKALAPLIDQKSHYKVQNQTQYKSQSKNISLGLLLAMPILKSKLQEVAKRAVENTTLLHKTITFQTNITPELVLHPSMNELERKNAR